MSQATRIEHDALGPVEVPADRLWGAQTQRSLANFVIGRPRHVWGRAAIRAFGLVKQAAAIANQGIGTLDPAIAQAIARAAAEVAEGQWDAEFPLVVFQTGSGTQSNMNANEVIARRAMQIAPALDIHPNDHVNRSQSSNDAFPTMMHVAAVLEIAERLTPAIDALNDTLAEKSRAFADVVMIGRTHLQDATPVTLGQVISGWQAQLDQAEDGLARALDGLRDLAMGGTAVGTGLNAPAEFGAVVAMALQDLTGQAFRPAANRFAALSAHDAVITASAALRTLAMAAMKIANDVRWYASGPRAGIGEITIPENEPGSSIMPGKINPTQCEALTMVAVQVFGNDAAIAFAGSQGNFQLNVFKPVMLENLLDSIALLADALDSFDSHCARGIEPDRGRIAENLERSLMLVTALNPHIGYEKSAQIALKAHREGRTLRQAALDLGHVSAEEFDRWIRPDRMV